MQKIKELTKAKLVHEIEKQVQAYCTLQLWKSVYGNISDADIYQQEQEEMGGGNKSSITVDRKLSGISNNAVLSPQDLQGEEDFIQWMSRLLLENQR